MTAAKIQKPADATNLIDATRPRDQQREFISFLTWPFVLAQALAAERILDSTIGTAQAEEEKSTLARSVPSELAASDDYATVASWTNRKSAEEEPRDPNTDAAALADVPEESTDLASKPRAGERAGDASDHEKTSNATGGGGNGGSASRPPDDSDLSDRLELADAPGASDILLDTAQSPLVLDIADDALGGVGNIVQSLGGTLVPTLDAVTDLVGDTVGIAGEVLLATTSTVDAIISPVVPGLEITPAVATLENSVEGLANGLLGSDGVITFASVTPSALPADDLFTDGRHTDYGLALRTITTEIIGSGQAADSAAPTARSIAPQADDPDGLAHDGDQSGFALSAMTDLTTAIDEFTLRGSDSMI
jgi:hypothetical protein